MAAHKGSTQINTKKKALIAALHKSLGNVTQACEMVGIDRGTFYNYVKKDQAFAETVQDIENHTFDYVEAKIFEQIRGGNTAMIIFYAKTKMKKRGYVERTEISNIEGVQVIVNGKDDANLLKRIEKIGKN